MTIIDSVKGLFRGEETQDQKELRENKEEEKRNNKIQESLDREAREERERQQENARLTREAENVQARARKVRALAEEGKARQELRGTRRQEYFGGLRSYLNPPKKAKVKTNYVVKKYVTKGGQQVTVRVPQKQGGVRNVVSSQEGNVLNPVRYSAFPDFSAPSASLMPSSSPRSNNGPRKSLMRSSMPSGVVGNIYGGGFNPFTGAGY